MGPKSPKIVQKPGAEFILLSSPKVCPVLCGGGLAFGSTLALFRPRGRCGEVDPPNEPLQPVVLALAGAFAAWQLGLWEKS